MRTTLAAMPPYLKGFFMATPFSLVFMRLTLGDLRSDAIGGQPPNGCGIPAMPAWERPQP
jgi:hypothetical protein